MAYFISKWGNTQLQLGDRPIFDSGNSGRPVTELESKHPPRIPLQRSFIFSFLPSGISINGYNTPLTFFTCLHDAHQIKGTTCDFGDGHNLNQHFPGETNVIKFVYVPGEAGSGYHRINEIGLEDFVVKGLDDRREWATWGKREKTVGLEVGETCMEPFLDRLGD